MIPSQQRCSFNFRRYFKCCQRHKIIQSTCPKWNLKVSIIGPRYTGSRVFNQSPQNAVSHPNSFRRLNTWQIRVKTICLTDLQFALQTYLTDGQLPYRPTFSYNHPIIETPEILNFNSFSWIFLQIFFF